MRKSLVPIAVVLLMGLLLGACSVEMDIEGDGSTLGQTIPDLALRNIRHALIRDGKPLLLLYASEILVFSEANRREMTSVRFEQYSADGSLEASGWAARAVQDIVTENVDFTGEVRLEILQEDTELTTQNLTWKAETKEFSSPLGEAVTLTRGRYTRIEGSGFILDTLSRTLTFTGGASGTLSTE